MATTQDDSAVTPPSKRIAAENDGDVEDTNDESRRDIAAEALLTMSHHVPHSDISCSDSGAQPSNEQSTPAKTKLR